MIRILLPLSIVAILLAPLSSQACSCRRPPPPKDALKAAGAVFSGKVVKVERVGNQNKVTFRVSRVWKGVTKKQVTVITNVSSAACGYGFKKDGSYLVYCYIPKGKKPAELHTNICMRTKSIKSAGADLKEIGKGEKLTGSSSGSE